MVFKIKRRIVPRPRFLRFKKRSAPGSAPGTIVSDPAAPKPTFRVIRYNANKFYDEKIANVADLTECVEDGFVTWIDITGLGDSDVIHAVGDLFSIHPLVLEDVVNVHQRPKVEEFDQQLFVVARMIARTTKLETEQLSLFLGEKFVLTFQERPGDCFDSVRKRIRKKVGRIRDSGSDYLAYALLDSVVDSYYPTVEQYGDLLDSADDEITLGPRADTLNRLHSLRHELRALRRIIWRTRDMFNSLIRDDYDRISKETGVFLRDCYDHTHQLLDVVESYRELSTDLRELYLTQIANRTNDIMRFLTVVTTIFVPLGFITGLYGMNFNPEISQWNMPELNWAYGYPFALGLMTAVALGLIVYFWIRGWLNK